MNWIANLGINGVATVMMLFCLFILGLRIAVKAISEKYDEDYEEDED